MFTPKVTAFAVLALAVEISPDGLLKWVAGLATTVVGYFVLREIDRITTGVKSANAGVAALRTEVAVLKQRVSQLEAQRRPGGTP